MIVYIHVLCFPINRLYTFYNNYVLYVYEYSRKLVHKLMMPVLKLNLL